MDRRFRGDHKVDLSRCVVRGGGGGERGQRGEAQFLGLVAGTDQQPAGTVTGQGDRVTVT